MAVSGKVNAALVSRTLAEGGMTRASAYRSFGRETGGFVVFKSGDDVVVSMTVHYEPGRVMCEQAEKVLVEAGYTVKLRGRNGVGGTYSLEVTR